MDCAARAAPSEVFGRSQPETLHSVAPEMVRQLELALGWCLPASVLERSPKGGGVLCLLVVTQLSRTRGLGLGHLAVSGTREP